MNILAFLKIKIEKFKRLQHEKCLPPNPMHDDIYIVEFPKSGVTWLQHLIGNIELQLANKNAFITFYNVHKYIPDVHQLKGSNLNHHFERNFIKSHSIYNPYYYFVIYLLRNPYDVMVSYYNFLSQKGYNKDFMSFISNKKFGVVAWKKHVKSWLYKKTSAQRIHLIKYEDLVSNTKLELRNLYRNLGVDFSEKILDDAVNNSIIDKMSNYEEHYRMYNPNYGISFVGKKGKIKKEELMTYEAERYIRDCAGELLEQFYGSSD